MQRTIGSVVSRRSMSGVTGLVLVALGILLQIVFPEHPAVVQVTLLTILVSAMIALGNYRQHREKWFWKAMLYAVLIHGVVLLNLRARLPFSGLGPVILISVPEAILLQGVIILASRSFSN